MATRNSIITTLLTESLASTRDALAKTRDVLHGGARHLTHVRHGGVTLIGNPNAAAVPVTDELLRNYDCFLAWERRKLVQQVYGPAWVEREPTWFPVPYPAMQWHHPSKGEPPCPPIETRAAVVLAAVGCPLTGGFNV